MVERKSNQFLKFETINITIKNEFENENLLDRCIVYLIEKLIGYPQFSRLDCKQMINHYF